MPEAAVQPAQPAAPIVVTTQAPLRSTETHEPARQALSERLAQRNGQEPEKAPVQEPAKEGQDAPTEAPAEEGTVELADTLDGVAQQLGISVDDLMQRKVVRKVAGQEQTITIADALKSSMLEADYSRGKNELADRQRAFDSAIGQIHEHWKTRMGALDANIQTFENMLGRRPDPSLAAQDPAGYVQQIAAWDSLKGVLDQAKSTRDAEQARFQQENDGKVLNYRRAQTEALYSRVPELRDTSNAEKFKGRMYSELPKLGFSGDEITQFISSPWDHRQMVILKEWLDYKGGQAKLDEGKLAKLPPVRIKPLASLGKPSPKDAVTQALTDMKKLPSKSQDRKEATRNLFSAKLAERAQRSAR